jgi:uncharacterized protein YggE
MRKLIVAALLAACQSGTATAQAAPEQPRIIVDGRGEVKTMPDVATLSYTVRGEGTTSDEAVRAMAAKGRTIHAMLLTLDKTLEMTSDEVRVTPVKGSACKDRDYDGDDQLSKGVCAVVGYVATQDVTVRTGSINDAGTMVGLAGRGEAYDAQIGGFGLRDQRPLRQQAIAAALADAQAKAALLASGSKVALGPILSVVMGDRAVTVLSSQDIKLRGTTRTENLINSLPQSFAKPITVSVTPAPITTDATVVVTYAIVP